MQGTGTICPQFKGGEMYFKKSLGNFRIPSTYAP